MKKEKTFCFEFTRSEGIALLITFDEALKARKTELFFGRKVRGEY